MEQIKDVFNAQIALDKDLSLAVAKIDAKNSFIVTITTSVSIKTLNRINESLSTCFAYLSADSFISFGFLQTQQKIFVYHELKDEFRDIIPVHSIEDPSDLTELVYYYDSSHNSVKFSVNRKHVFELKSLGNRQNDGKSVRLKSSSLTINRLTLGGCEESHLENDYWTPCRIDKIHLSNPLFEEYRVVKAKLNFFHMNIDVMSNKNCNLQ